MPEGKKLEPIALFAWFKVRDPKQWEKDEKIKEYVFEGKIEFLVSSSKESREYDEHIFLVKGPKPKSDKSVIQEQWPIVRDNLILPEGCMISAVGDIYCAKKQIIFTLTHFGRGYWGYIKRILPNRSHFQYCPECGGKLSGFPWLRSHFIEGDTVIGGINEEDR